MADQWTPLIQKYSVLAQISGKFVASYFPNLQICSKQQTLNRYQCSFLNQNNQNAKLIVMFITVNHA